MVKSAKALESAQEGGAFKCPHCGSSRVIKDHGSGEVICTKCGTVVREKYFDCGPEWRAYDQEGRESKSRAGPPRTETIHDRGLSTQIDYKNRDARGKNLSPEKRARMYRLRKWHNIGKVRDAKDRNLIIALGELKRLSSQLGLPQSVEEGASQIYREVVEGGMVRGRSIESMVSAVVYLECRRENIPRTLAEVAEVSSVDAREIGRDQRVIEKKLGVSSGTTDPADLVNRFGSRLGLSRKTRRKAIDLIKKAQREGLTSGRSPSGIAAGALYIACCMNDERRIQREMAEAANVTEVTLRNRYKEMQEELKPSVEKKEGGPPIFKGEPIEKKREEKPKVGDIEAKNIKWENVVASVVFKDTVFDLEKLADAFDLDYRPKNFPGVSYSPEGTEATFLIFEPGKANCVGTSSISGARKAPRLLAEKLADEGFEVDPDPEVEIQNIVVRADFGVTIDLEALHDSPHETSYDPGSFPGLQLVLDEPDVDFLLFASGQGILHAGREEDVEPAFERASEILQDFASGAP